MEGGYSGSILYVDLTTGTSHKEELDIELAKTFLGGFGINNRLAFDLIKPGIDPLSPRNPIIIGAGPFVGAFPGATKIVGTTKLCNGFVRTAIGGGGAMLKYAGYDHLVLTGKAKSPVYLKIFDDDVDLCDANELWGRDVYESADLLWNKHGRECSSIVIGQAGERLIPIALTFIDKQIGSFGKGGLATIMGSKNLKAVVMRGTKGVKVAEKRKFAKIFDESIHLASTWEDRQAFLELSYFRQKSFDSWTNQIGEFLQKMRARYIQRISWKSALRILGRNV